MNRRFGKLDEAATPAKTNLPYARHFSTKDVRRKVCVMRTNYIIRSCFLPGTIKRHLTVVACST